MCMATVWVCVCVCKEQKTPRQPQANIWLTCPADLWDWNSVAGMWLGPLPLPSPFDCFVTTDDSQSDICRQIEYRWANPKRLCKLKHEPHEHAHTYMQYAQCTMFKVVPSFKRMQGFVTCVESGTVTEWQPKPLVWWEGSGVSMIIMTPCLLTTHYVNLQSPSRLSRKTNVLMKLC